MWGVLWENQLDKQINRYSDYWSFGITLIEHVFVGRASSASKPDSPVNTSQEWQTLLVNCWTWFADYWFVILFVIIFATLIFNYAFIGYFFIAAFEL